MANIIREADDERIWARLHARQALVLGLLGSFAFFLVLGFPLVTVLAIPSISNGTTIAVYGAGLILDLVFGGILLLIGLRYAARAARGELFAIPLVTPIVDRWFRLKQP